MKRKRIGYALALACAFVPSGCILPSPGRVCVFEGLRGKVVDAATGQPIPGVDVSVACEPWWGIWSGDDVARDRGARTDREGNFRAPPEYQWHYLCIWTPPLSHTWPHPHKYEDVVRLASVGISHPEYEVLVEWLGGTNNAQSLGPPKLSPNSRPAATCLLHRKGESPKAE